MNIYLLIITNKYIFINNHRSTSLTVSNNFLCSGTYEQMTFSDVLFAN